MSDKLDEASMERVIQSYYEAIAAEYDGYIQQDRVRCETRSLLGLANIVHGETFLDVACGTGRILAEAGLATASACGVDVSPAMLKVLKDKMQGQYIHLVVASAHRLPFRPSSIDIITCAGLTGYYRLGRITSMLREFKRILREEGRAAIDFLVDENPGSQAIQREEAEEGINIYLYPKENILSTIKESKLTVAAERSTESQLQLLIRKPPATNDFKA